MNEIDIENLDRMRMRLLDVRSKVNGKCSNCHGNIIGDKRVVKKDGEYFSYCSNCFDERYVDAVIRGEELKFYLIPQELL